MPLLGCGGLGAQPDSFDRHQNRSGVAYPSGQAVAVALEGAEGESWESGSERSDLAQASQTLSSAGCAKVQPCFLFPNPVSVRTGTFAQWEAEQRESGGEQRDLSQLAAHVCELVESDRQFTSRGQRVGWSFKRSGERSLYACARICFG